MKRTPADIQRTVRTEGNTTIETLHPGALVFCDDCGEDFTDRADHGGILFQSKALCPVCAPKWEQGAKEYGEERFIRGRCQAGVSFADWVRGLR